MEPQCSLGWDPSSLHLCWELRLSHSSSNAKPDPESRSARSALILKPTDGTPLSIHWLSKERSSWSTWGTRNAKQPRTVHFHSPSVSKAKAFPQLFRPKTCLQRARKPGEFSLLIKQVGPTFATLIVQGETYRKHTDRTSPSCLDLCPELRLSLSPADSKPGKREHVTEDLSQS